MRSCRPNRLCSSSFSFGLGYLIGGIRLGSFTLGPVAGVLFARSAVPALGYTRAYALADVLLTIARSLVLLFY
jgi:hypothetical protein